MKSDTLYSFLKSLTILIPLLIGLIRFNKIDRSYKPFIIYLLIGCVTEVITFIFFARNPGKSNAAISNTYVLAEWILILWQFSSWGFFKQSKTRLYATAIIAVVVWVTENIIYGNFSKDFGPYFRVLYSFILVLMSVNIINYTIIHDEKNIFKNSCFLICLSFVIVFIYKLIYEWAYQYSLYQELTGPRKTMTAAFGYVNAFQKLLLILAVLFIPERKNFEIKTRNITATGPYNNG